MRIVAVHGALPEHYYSQEDLTLALMAVWGPRFHNPARLEQLHRHVCVGGRHLALPLEEYPALKGLTEKNDAFIRCALPLGEAAVRGALEAAGLRPEGLHHVFFTTVTGLGVPSIEARLSNRLGFSPHVKRTPLFGLGCVAGAAGVARAADYLRAFPDEAALLLSVELCSLTLQSEDLSIANIIASGLFGDGAAAVVMVGDQHPLASRGGPRVQGTRSVFYPDTERVMGWDITSSGFKVVLSAEVPDVVRRFIRRDVDAFLADRGLCLHDIGTYVCHPGGPRILEAFEQALDLPREALALTWDSLARVGNLSSASVLLVLEQTLAERRPPPGALGLMLAMGPGFCSELVLLGF